MTEAVEADLDLVLCGGGAIAVGGSSAAVEFVSNKDGSEWLSDSSFFV